MSITNKELTDEDIALYKEFYDECDLDSDGFIDKRGVSKKESQSAFPVFDASKDGKINFDEFLAQLLNVSNAKLEKEESERKVVQAQVELYSSYFNLWDKDSNGKLDKEEFGKLLTLRKVPKEHIDIVFQCFDFNKDQVINFDEFFKILLVHKQKKDHQPKERKKI